MTNVGGIQYIENNGPHSGSPRAVAGVEVSAFRLAMEREGVFAQRLPS